MELEIEKSALLSALKLARGAVAASGAHEPLTSVLLCATTDGRLVCSGTDSIVSLAATALCPVAVAGELCLRAKGFVGVVDSLPAGPVKLLGLEGSWLQVSAGRTELRLMGSAGGDFPELPSSSGLGFVGVPAGVLVDVIDKVLPSVLAGESRPNLNGALLESDGETMSGTSTDGHRLTRYTVELAGPVLPKGVVVPRAGLVLIRRTLSNVSGDVGLAVDDEHIFVKTPHLTMGIKLTKARFPNWQQVIPKDSVRRATVVRKDLIAALQRGLTVSTSLSSVLMTLQDGGISLSTESPNLGSSVLVVDAKYRGKTVTVTLNAGYLLDALKGVDTDEVWFDVDSPIDPAVIAPEVKQGGSTSTFVAVVMPMSPAAA